MRIKTLAVSAIGTVLLLCAGQKTGAAAEMAKLVAYKVDGYAITKSLTGKPGNAIEGRKVAINRQKGNCLACHVMPIPEQQFHGEIGPDLTGVGSRYKEGELRLRVVNPKALNEDTIMPAFYHLDGLKRVNKKFKGKTVLSAQEVEDVVAYLVTLK